MDKELATRTDAPMVMDTLSLEQAQEQFTKLQAFIKSQLKKDRDFGIIPGCKKPSLWKPGAERLLFFHGLGCKLESTSETVVDWKVGFFNYCYRATVYNPRTNVVIATAEGSCNSKEAKYRYIWLPEKKLPRGVDKDDLESRDGKYGPMYRIDNPDVYSLVNTIQKMGSKRAMVAAVLIACRASDVFTQDEDAAPTNQSPNTSKPASKPAGSAQDPDCISPAQKRRLIAIQNEANISDEDLKSYLFDKYDYLFDAEGKVHLSKIKKRTDYKAICDWLEGKDS